MTESDIYQIVGEAYCAGLSEGMRKQASSVSGTGYAGGMTKQAGVPIPFQLEDVGAVGLGGGLLGATAGGLGSLLQSLTSGADGRTTGANALNKAEKGAQIGALTGIGSTTGKYIGKLLAPLLKEKLGSPLLDDIYLAQHGIGGIGGVLGGALGGLGGYFLPTLSKDPFAKKKES